MTVPAFDLGPGGLWLAGSRGLFVATTMLAYGTALFRCRLAIPSLKAISPADGVGLTLRYRKLARNAIAMALVLLALWLALQTKAMAGTQGLWPTVGQIPTVLKATAFGHTMMLQALALSAALGTIIWRKPDSETFAFTAFLAGCAIVGQAWHGHAAAMQDGFSPLLLCEIVHLLAGAAWLGTLVPLAMLVRNASLQPALIAARRYGRFGTVCVIALLVTAFWQGYILIGSVSALVGSAYGWLALVKLAIVCLLLLLAALNRFWLTRAGAQVGLARSIALETSFGLAIVLVAGTLVMLPPGMHM